MANTILIKKRGTAGAPAPGDLAFGELAINYSTDGTTGQRLYYKDSAGNIQYIASGAVTSSVTLNNVSAAIAGTTIANGSSNIVWNWQLTGAETGFKIGETAASTGATNILFEVATVSSSSTASPFRVGIGANDIFLVDNTGNLVLTALGGTAGADVDITAGSSTSGTAGNVNITAGSSTLAATGNITIQTPNTAGTDVNGGDIAIITGDGNGTGRSGNVRITLGTGATDGTFTIEHSTVDRFVVDASGRIQINGAAGSSELNVAGAAAVTGIIFPASATAFKVDMTGAGNGEMLVYNSTSGYWESSTITTGGTVTSVAATAPAAGFTISGSPITTNGTLTFALANDLAALEGLSGTGIAVRTGSDTWAQRSVTSSGSTITVTNPAGVAGNINVDLPNVGSPVTGSFVKITTDAQGRVSATTAVVAGDITGLVDSSYVNVGGDTMTGNLTMSSGGTVTGIPTPTNASDATPKSYVDAVTSGLSWKTAVKVATTAAGTLATSFENGDTVDGVTLTTGDRILIKNQGSGQENGIYIVQASGAPVRATDADSVAELDGAAVFVQQGTANADTAWVQTATVVTVDTTPLVFTQFGAGAVYVAGVGLDLTGNSFSVNLGAGIAQLPTDEVGISIYSYTGSALGFADSGGVRVATEGAAVTGDTLRLFLDGSTLSQSGTGLKVASGGITGTELNTSVAGSGLAGGGGSALSVNTTGASTGIATDNVIVRSTATAGQVLRSTGSDGAEATWGALNLASSDAVTGVLDEVNGGTGQSTFTTGDLLYASASNTLSKLALGTAEYFLKVNAGGTQVEWSNTVDGGTY